MAEQTAPPGRALRTRDDDRSSPAGSGHVPAHRAGGATEVVDDGRRAGSPQPGQQPALPDHSPGHPAHAAEASPNRWLILVVLALAQLMVVLDATIVNIALPSAQRELGFGNADRQWVITAYSLAFGGLLLVGGRLADLLGRRRLLLVGLVGFAAASAVGGASGGIEQLVISRAAQGVFGALMAPAALSLLTVTFTDPAERGRAFGIFGAIAGAGAAVGLLLGGALTEYADWSWCLYVNVPIAVVTIAGAVLLLPKGADAAGARLDVPGTLTAVLGLVALVYGFSRAETEGWLDGVTLGLFVAAVVLLVAFVVLQRTVRAPLLPLRVVLDRRRGGAYLAVGLAAIGMFAVFLFLTYYMQLVLGFAPLTTGVAFLPMVVGIITSSTGLVPRLLPRTGPRPLIPTGAVLGAAGLFWMSRLEVGSSYWVYVLPSLLVMGLGMGLIFGSSFNSATSGAERRDAGVASAMVNTGQQVGGAIGTALLNTLASSATASALAAGAARAGGGAPSAALQLQASVAGETRAFLIASGIFLLTAVVTAVVLPSGPAAAPRGAPAPAPAAH